MNIIASWSFFLKDYAIFFLPGACLGILLIAFSGSLFSKWARLQILGYLIGGIWAIAWIIAFVNMFAGDLVRNSIIERYGIEGEGIFVSSIATSTRRNYSLVIQYTVTIRTAGDSPIQVYSYSDDFNVVGKKDNSTTIYPNIGMKFRVRYIPSNPRAFVILTDTESEYGKMLLHDAYMKEYNEITNQLKMDPSNPKLNTRVTELMEKDNTIYTLEKTRRQTPKSE